MSASARRHNDHAEIRFDYQAAAVNAIKTTAPRWARTWNATARHWTIDEPYVDTALAAIEPYVGRILIADLRNVTAKTPSSGWADALLDALPNRLHRPAYLALQRVVHPDRGGDHTLTQQLNAAYDKKAAS